MKGFVIKTLTGWSPADEQAKLMHKRGKVGQVFRAEIVQPRSYEHHKLFFALLDLTFENQDTYKDSWAFRTAVALEAGHVKEFVTLDGEIRLIPMRYSYDDIPDEGDFTVEFGKAMTVCARLLHNISLTELEAEVGRYADSHYSPG